MIQKVLFTSNDNSVIEDHVFEDDLLRNEFDDTITLFNSEYYDFCKIWWW